MLRFSDGADVLILGVKIYYADGSILRIRFGDIRDAWPVAPAVGVQVVVVFYARTYRIHRPTHVSANDSTWADPAKQFEDRHYTEKHTGQDYYYWSPQQGFGAWPVPAGRNEPGAIPPDAVIKTGSLIEKEPYRALTNVAWNDFFWS